MTKEEYVVDKISKEEGYIRHCKLWEIALNQLSPVIATDGDGKIRSIAFNDQWDEMKHLQELQIKRNNALIGIYSAEYDLLNK